MHVHQQTISIIAASHQNHAVQCKKGHRFRPAPKSWSSPARPSSPLRTVLARVFVRNLFVYIRGSEISRLRDDWYDDELPSCSESPLQLLYCFVAASTWRSAGPGKLASSNQQVATNLTRFLGRAVVFARVRTGAALATSIQPQPTPRIHLCCQILNASCRLGLDACTRRHAYTPQIIRYLKNLEEPKYFKFD
jgi:hypothetical protein